MRAVNLVPSDGPQRRGAPSGLSLDKIGPVHVLLAVLVIALAYVTVYVMSANTISQRKAQLATVQTQAQQERAQLASLASYTKFEQLAQQRAETVREIAASRFDWHGALTDLSKVMPANTSLQSLVATVAPSSAVTGGGGAPTTSSSSGTSVRGDINAPAFELKGCTASQDDVARLVSRLRLVNGVQRVTLEDSTAGAAGSASAATTTPSGPGSGSCGANGPTFDLVVFFQPQSGALASSAAQPTSSSSPSGASK